MEIIYNRSSNLIEAIGVLSAASNSYINDADVSVTLTDRLTQSEIAGQAWPFSMAYVDGSDGDYRGTLSEDLEFTESQRILALVVIDAGMGLYREIEIECIVIGP